MITTYLEKATVDRIAHIGRKRAPAEACGILLPTPHKGHRVWEMPNRSMGPSDSFEMHGEDIAITLADYEGDFEQLVLWHTHPSGGVGPSRNDLQCRHERVANLVITLLPNDEAVATFY